MFSSRIDGRLPERLSQSDGEAQRWHVVGRQEAMKPINSHPAPQDTETEIECVVPAFPPVLSARRPHAVGVFRPDRRAASARISFLSAINPNITDFVGAPICKRGKNTALAHWVRSSVCLRSSIWIDRPDVSIPENHPCTLRGPQGLDERCVVMSCFQSPPVYPVQFRIGLLVGTAGLLVQFCLRLRPCGSRPDREQQHTKKNYDETHAKYLTPTGRISWSFGDMQRNRQPSGSAWFLPRPRRCDRRLASYHSTWQHSPRCLPLRRPATLGRPSASDRTVTTESGRGEREWSVPGCPSTRATGTEVSCSR